MNEDNTLDFSSKEDLVNQIEMLEEQIKEINEENSKTKSNLMWKVRKVEKDKVLIENEKIRLEI